MWGSGAGLLLLLGALAGAQEAEETVSDPLPSLYIRQEATLRKLDGLIAKVSQVDQLEDKLDRVTGMLLAQAEAKGLLQAHVEQKAQEAGMKIEEVMKKLEQMMDKVEGMENKVMEMGKKVEEIGDKMMVVEEKVEDTGGKLEALDGKQEFLLGSMMEAMEEQSAACGREVAGAAAVTDWLVEAEARLQETWRVVNASVEQVEASVCQVEARLEREAEWQINSSVEARGFLQEVGLNLSLVVAEATQGLHDSLQDTVTRVLNHTCQAGCRDAAEDSTPPTPPSEDPNNTTQLLTNAISLIKVSNQASDKRMAALLHTTTLRQHILQDSLLVALASLSSLMRSQTQELYRKVEARLAGLQDALGAAVKLHAKDLASQVLEAANHTLGDVASAAASHLDLLLQAQLNTSGALDEALYHLLHLHNLTAAAHPCPPTEEEEEEEEEQLEEAEDAGNRSVVALVDPRQTCVDHQLPAATNLSAAVEEARVEVEAGLERVDQQLSGLRIYYSTSLHMHTEQVVEEVREVEAAVRRGMQESLARQIRTLDKLRRSSLGYLDAAVTSVSSAAVASAQATADQLNRALKLAAHDLHARLDQLESHVRAGSCGSPFSRVEGGAGACLLPLPALSTTWQLARERCRDLGADLASALHPSLLQHLPALLHPHHNDTPPSYWVGGQWVGGQWEVVGGAHLSKDVDGQTGHCLGLGGDTSLLSLPCDTAQPALCQLPPTPAPTAPYLGVDEEEERNNNVLPHLDYLYLPVDEFDFD